MFGLEVGTTILLLIQIIALVAYAVRVESLTRSNTKEIEELTKEVEKTRDTLNLFKLEAASKYASQENMKSIKDEIAYEIRRLGDRLDKVFDIFQSNVKNHRDT